MGDKELASDRQDRRAARPDRRTRCAVSRELVSRAAYAV